MSLEKQEKRSGKRDLFLFAIGSVVTILATFAGLLLANVHLFGH